MRNEGDGNGTGFVCLCICANIDQNPDAHVHMAPCPCQWLSLVLLSLSLLLCWRSGWHRRSLALHQRQIPPREAIMSCHVMLRSTTVTLKAMTGRCCAVHSLAKDHGTSPGPSPNITTTSLVMGGIPWTVNVDPHSLSVASPCCYWRLGRPEGCVSLSSELQSVKRDGSGSCASCECQCKCLAGAGEGGVR